MRAAPVLVPNRIRAYCESDHSQDSAHRSREQQSRHVSAHDVFL
jgi:hypothetical protein